MPEYWWSARQTCIELLGHQFNATSLPKSAPQYFRRLRPWVNHGWEMVLLAAESIRPDSQLVSEGTQAFTTNYSLMCQQALNAWGWQSRQLQESLENVRRRALAVDAKRWLALHKPFPDVINRLRCLDAEGIDLAVLTTKGAEFTESLLKSIHLKPNMIYGHESGSKTEVLLQLVMDRSIQGFLEDRRATLETVLATPGLTALPCYLASWGYLKPKDQYKLPKGIRLLNSETLATPLASWL